MKYVLPPCLRTVARATLLASTVALLGIGPVGACTDFTQASHARWRIVREDGANWLRTPCGDRFFSIGVNIVSGGTAYADGRRHYHWRFFDPTVEAWARRNRERLRNWGYNTAGGWSLPPSILPMPFIANLELGRLARFHWFDPLHPETELRMRRLAPRLVESYRGNPHRIGYFSDNEVGWWRGTLFTFYVQEPARNRTKQRLIERLADHYGGDWSKFAGDFIPPRAVESFADLMVSEGRPVRLRPGGRGIDFVRAWAKEITEGYYRMTAGAVRAADPDALFLGDRLPIYYDPDAIASMSRYVDLIATNYNVDSPDGWLARYFFDGLSELTDGKAVLISEWFFAAHENRSGNVNNGHLMTVATQGERAAGAAAAIRRFAGLKDLVGIHWFQFFDHPPGGRDDGEDYNFGLVDVDDRPYEDLIERMAAAHREVPMLHAAAGRESRHRVHRGELPHARIVVGDNVLTEWPKARGRLPRLSPKPGEVPFGEAYAAWGREGLSIAFIGMDYYDLALLDFDGAFPRSESFRIDLGVDAGTGPQRFRLSVIPPRDGPPKNWPQMQAELCRAEDAECRPIAGAMVSYFGADQPRVTTELTLPWSAFGLSAAPVDRQLRLDIAATAWYRSRWMSLSGKDPDAAMADPRYWTAYRLAEPTAADEAR
jgi:hypothetical protein